METQGLVKPTQNAKSHTKFRGYVSHTGEIFEAGNLKDLCAEIEHHIPINFAGIGVDPKDWEDKPVGHGWFFLEYYWMVKLKEENELGKDCDYYLRGVPLIESDFRKEKVEFIASCNAEEKKHWYDDVLTNEEHLTHGYLEITKVKVPTPQLGPVAPVVASRKSGAPIPDVAPDVAPGGDSARKRVRRHQHARRMSEYQVISCRGSYSMVGKLNEQVKKMMKDGWQPLGGPSIKAQEIIQAMVKYK